MLTCRVAVEQASAQRVNGALYQASVRVRFPGREFVASHGHDKDIHIALREAFDAVRRQLTQATDTNQGDGERQPARKAKVTS